MVVDETDVEGEDVTTVSMQMAHRVHAFTDDIDDFVDDLNQLIILTAVEGALNCFEEGCDPAKDCPGRFLSRQRRLGVDIVTTLVGTLLQLHYCCVLLPLSRLST